jgi:hypothetical protein
MAITFDRQDEDYLEWVDEHQHGFVVNALRNLNPGYLMLHHASCGTISGTPTRGKTWTHGDYIKVCAESLEDLRRWAAMETRGRLQPCKRCHPE